MDTAMQMLNSAAELLVGRGIQSSDVEGKPFAHPSSSIHYRIRIVEPDPTTDYKILWILPDSEGRWEDISVVDMHLRYSSSRIPSLPIG